jgi:NADH dehydrogenase/NADH:ubiquinone oxidoreductase subunit G
MVTVSIDGREAAVSAGTTLLDAARGLGIEMPTLCHDEHLTPWGGCRVCLVEVGFAAAPGRTRLLPACSTRVEDGMAVRTATERVSEARKFILQLLLSRSPDAPRIQELARLHGAVGADGSPPDPIANYPLRRVQRSEDTRCIRCGLCVRVCAEIPRRHAISFEGRGMKRRVLSPFNKVAETCIGCGSCAYVCPTKTITIEEAGASG